MFNQDSLKSISFEHVQPVRPSFFSIHTCLKNRIKLIKSKIDDDSFDFLCLLMMPFKVFVAPHHKLSFNPRLDPARSWLKLGRTVASKVAFWIWGFVGYRLCSSPHLISLRCQLLHPRTKGWRLSLGVVTRVICFLSMHRFLQGKASIDIVCFLLSSCSF